MSNIRAHKAHLPGYSGPFFNGLRPIQQLLVCEPAHINEVLMGEVRERLNGEPTQRLVLTDDAYTWLFGLSFSHYNRKVMVLIPSLRDEKKRHGTRADRHVALYYEGNPLTVQEIERIGRKVATAFEDAYEEVHLRPTGT